MDLFNILSYAHPSCKTTDRKVNKQFKKLNNVQHGLTDDPRTMKLP